jgi:hypothetical protein
MYAIVNLEVAELMKTALIILGACFAALCVASSAVLIGAFYSQRELRDANRRMEATLRTAQTTTDTLRAEKQEMAQQLSVLQELTESLQSKAAARANDGESQGKIPAVAPYQAQAFLGKTSLGWVWIIPQNLRKDTNTQRYVYEPVVWLDEGLRKQFVTHHTNVVEREVESRYVNTTYYPEPYWYGYGYYYPTYSRPPIGSNCPPTFPSHPIQPVPPTPIHPVAAQPFNPGTGKVTVQQLGTPAGAIRTRAVP